jgi:ParB-like chromosome segregation protein Spo0J
VYPDLGVIGAVMTTPVIERVPVSSLTSYPGNPRRHDIAMIAESLRENTQYKPLICQKSTGHVLAGNGTLAAAISLGWQEIDALYLDIDDLLAKKIVLVDNRASDVASYSADDLAALLVTLDDFTGTGYTVADLARLSPDLPEGFEELDPDAPAPEPAMITCPNCGHSWHD